MTDTKHKEHITSEDFGIPADLADRAENYAEWRMQALSEQLAEAQTRVDSLEAIEKQLSDNVIWQAGEIAKHLSTIEASRKQEVKGWLIEYESLQARDNRVQKFDCVWVKKSFVSDLKDAGSEASNARNRTERPLYENPVVAPDVLKNAQRYLWLRDSSNWPEVMDGTDAAIICGYAGHEDILSDHLLDAAIDAAIGGAV